MLAAQPLRADCVAPFLRATVETCQPQSEARADPLLARLENAR